MTAGRRSLPEGVRSMEGLDHILEDETYFFELGSAKGEFLLGRRFRNEPGCSVEPTAALVL